MSNVSQQNQKSALQSDATILIAPAVPLRRDETTASTPVVGLTSVKLNFDQPWLYAVGAETGLLRICSTDYLNSYI